MLVWIALVQHANVDGITWVSVRTLADECGMSETNVYASIRKLVARGLVRRCLKEFFVFDGLRNIPDMDSIKGFDALHQQEVSEFISPRDLSHQSIKGSKRPVNRPGEKTLYKGGTYKEYQAMEGETTTATQADPPAELEPSAKPGNGECARRGHAPRKYAVSSTQ
jgi:hypothetical protein